MQVASEGGKSLNVTLPVGVTPPDKVAVSFKTVPIGPPAEGVVAIVGEALPTLNGSQELSEEL